MGWHEEAEIFKYAASIPTIAGQNSGPRVIDPRASRGGRGNAASYRPQSRTTPRRGAPKYASPSFHPIQP